MLAERKKKVKWTLNPRGNSWSKDTNKFGQRMLEKMGWKSGEGLGVNKQGITEHIKVAYKNDNKCLGYKDSGEEWVEHQSQFESLLAELSSSHSTINALNSVKDKISQTETLEQRSRHSRTRVHYQKFTRGKDLSKYSEKDLKCILLGKQKANSADEENEDGSNEYFNGFYGIKTINSGSMNDYFKKLTNSQHYSNTYSSDVQFGEVDVSGKNNNIGEQCDVKVKKQKERKAEVQMSNTVCSNIDSNETLSIKQHKKRKKCKTEYSKCTNDDHSYRNYENGTVSKKGLQRYTITDAEGSIINGICNEELYCNEICKQKKPKKLKNCSIQNRECEVMEIDNEIEDKQMKKISRKKNYELITEDSGTSVVPADDTSSKLENSETVEHLTDKVDKIEIRQTKKESRKKHPMMPSEEETSHVPVECVLHGLKNAVDTLLHATVELDEVEGKQKKKKCKNKKWEFTGDDGEASLTPVDVSHRLENSKDTDHLSEEVEDKQLKKKSKKKNHHLLCEYGENSVLPAEAVDTEQHLTVKVVDEKERKQLKRKSKKEKHELPSGGGETVVVSVENISQIFENSENTVEHLMNKEEGKHTKGTHGALISLENDLKAADVNRLDHDGGSDNDLGSNEQTTDDVIPTKRKKKKNMKMDDVKNPVAEDFPKYVNHISVKLKHKRRKDENEVDGHGEQAEYAVKEDKKTNTDELQNAANSIHCIPQPIVNENTAEKLNKAGLGSCVKFPEKYSVDEIKNMKSSLFAQLVDARLVEFKGSNLHTIAGYGKW